MCRNIITLGEALEITLTLNMDLPKAPRTDGPMETVSLSSASEIGGFLKRVEEGLNNNFKGK